MRSVIGLAGVLAMLAAPALTGCGSSGEEAAKQARIATALRKFERELAAEKGKDLVHVTHGNDVLGVVNLFYAPAPAGVSKAEWNAALARDTRIHQLEMEASAATTGGPTMIELPTPVA